MTPRNKLIAACVALTVLVALATVRGMSATAVARAVLAVAAVAGIGWWWLRSQNLSTTKKFQLAPRMSVVSRAGLSQRTALALVEVDGRSFLVVHGDGYAEICSTAQEKKAARPRRATDPLPPFPEGDR